MVPTTTSPHTEPPEAIQMPYENIIGWRYLHHKPRKHGRLLLWLLMTFVGIGVLSALFWLLTRRAAPAPVFIFTAACIGAIVMGLLNVFTVFTSVSVFGVVLGVAALTVVMSVTSGFQGAFRDKVLGVNTHILVMKSAATFTNYRDVEEIVAGMDGVAAEQPFVFVEMLITRGKGEMSGIAMKGVDPSRIGGVLDLPKHMIEGTVEVLSAPVDPDAPPPLIIGKELATKLKAQVGDVVTLVLPNLEAAFRSMEGRAQPPKQRKFVVRGVFHSGFDEYDRRLVYVDIKQAQAFLGQGDSVMGVEMKLHDVGRAREIARAIEKQLTKLGPDYVVMDWRELNNNLFTALTLQKIALLVFMTLIIIVAAFNMIASLTMMVLDKTKEIAILKSMGASSWGIASVFQVVGLTIGGVGTALGVGLGLTLCAVMSRYGYPLDPKVYLIDKLPIQVDPFEVLLVGGITMVICFFATLYPAHKASSLRPVEGLRYD
jgi:lipoprotein-releasing system permease protein